MLATDMRNRSQLRNPISERTFDAKAVTSWPVCFGRRAFCLYSIGRGSTKMPVCFRIIQMSSLRLLQLRQKKLHEDATAGILAGSRRLDGNTCYSGFTITVTGNHCAEVSLSPRK